jgi:hypothetical protein
VIDWDSEHDPQLSALLRKCDPPPIEKLDVEALRRSIHAQAVPIMERNRRVFARKGWAVPAGAGLSLALAAALAALLLGRPDASSVPAGPGSVPRAGPEALVTADLSEDEFRALVSGAADTRSLLLVAAGDL